MCVGVLFTREIEPAFRTSPTNYLGLVLFFVFASPSLVACHGLLAVGACLLHCWRVSTAVLRSADLLRYLFLRCLTPRREARPFRPRRRVRLTRHFSRELYPHACARPSPRPLLHVHTRNASFSYALHGSDILLKEMTLSGNTASRASVVFVVGSSLRTSEVRSFEPRGLSSVRSRREKGVGAPCVMTACPIFRMAALPGLRNTYRFESVRCPRETAGLRMRGRSVP